MPDKQDFKKSLPHYQARKGRFDIIDVPLTQYLMIDGHGDPNTSPDFTGALEALYPVAYKLKFTSRAEHGRDYVVMPLEGLWWAEDMDAFTAARDKSQWDWTLMIMQPDWIDRSLFDAAVEATAAKAPARLDEVRLESLDEGRSVQILHVGSFDDEAPVLEELHRDFLPSNGLQPTGTHHEIYLSDTRKVAPEKQRTILRQPVAEA